MAAGVPVTNEHDEVISRRSKWQRHFRSIAHSDSTVATRSPLETGTGIVKETPNLILHLKPVGPVPARRNGTIRARDAILPCVVPMLEAHPSKTPTLTSALYLTQDDLNLAEFAHRISNSRLQ